MIESCKINSNTVYSGVIIELGLNETDGFLFDEFSLDLFRSDTDFNCKEAEPKVAFHFEVRSDVRNFREILTEFSFKIVLFVFKNRKLLVKRLS